MTANRIGIDFSQAYFDVLIADSTGRPVTPIRRFPHDGLGSQAALEWICHTCQAHPSDQVWIGGEATGLLWWHPFQLWAQAPQLAAYHPVFYQFNPLLIKRFRKTLPLNDKEDPKDARLITRYLGISDLELHPWYPDLAEWPLRLLTRYRYRLAHRLAALKIQAHTLLYLKASAYDLVQPFEEAFGRTSLAILLEEPTLERLIEQPLEELTAELTQVSTRVHLVTPDLTAQKLQQAARRSYPLDLPMAQTVQILFADLCERIHQEEAHLKHLDQVLAAQVAHDADVANLDQIGGIGPVYAAGLVAELRPTQRFLEGEIFDPRRGCFRPRTLRDAQASVGKLAGLWWPQNQSGQYRSEDARLPRAGNAYLRYYLVEAANHVRGHVAEYGAFYARKYKEATKHQHKRALVLTARKLARLVFVLLHKHQTYQPGRDQDS